MNDLIIQLSIITNPHIAEETDRRVLWDHLQELLGDDVQPVEEELDTAAMESLKLLMGQNPKIVVK